ncbi:hypothetical protein B9Z55_027819 [Caenorhabditis nigoni]|uniref:SPK domain-containing protein n=1 Tax=Caenorhabditis nigoni TaxID=1611254 RepID=A0A2G5SEH2_9PELO|nr:hypothetical protein B9Z55_027819 [Caenorhabditis nigoni]
MATRNDECEKAIRFMSSSIGHYTQPESIIKWCELAKTEAGYDKCAHSFRWVIRKRLDRIEHLQGYSLKEKVHLVFIFSRPVSKEFVEELKDAKCVVELNDSGRIMYSRSPDGDYVLQSEHDPNRKNFKGKPSYDKRKTADLQVRSSESDQNPPEIAANKQNQENKAPEMTNEKSILKQEEDVYVINENIYRELPFNGPINYDDLDNGEYPEFMVPAEYQPPKQHKKRHAELSQGNPKRFKIEKWRESDEEEDEEAALELEQISEDSNGPSFRVNDKSDIQNEVAPTGSLSIDNTDSSQDLCEKAIKFISNRIKNYTNPEKMVKWCELAKREVGYTFSPENFSRLIKERLDRVEDLRGYSLMEKILLVFIFSRPVSKAFVDELKEKNCTVELNDERRIAFFGSPDKTSFLKSKHSKKQKYFMGKPNYDNKKTAEEQARRSQSVQNPPDITSNNQKQENKAPQGRSSESVRNSTPPPSPQILQNSPEIDDVEAPEQNSLDSDDLGPIVNDSFNNQNQDAQPNFGENNQKRVKIEDFLEEIQQEPEVWIPEEKPEIPPPTLSLHKLAEQIETLAFNVNLEEGFQQKALRAARLFKANDQAFPIQDFNQLFNFFLTSLKRERTQNSNENSIKLIRLFKHLQRTLIRPLGEDLISEALGILDEEIQKREENEEKVFVPLKTVQSKIDGLMHFITSAWADLDQ